MLLKAILGELSLRNGSYTIPLCKSAYAAQDSFIFPGWVFSKVESALLFLYFCRTVQDNIVMGVEHDKKRYLRTLEGCALIPDLNRLPHGDQTRLGDKGTSLSGGQRQRLVSQ